MDILNKKSFWDSIRGSGQTDKSYYINIQKADCYGKASNIQKQQSTGKGGHDEKISKVYGMVQDFWDTVFHGSPGSQHRMHDYAGAGNFAAKGDGGHGSNQRLAYI
jgi:hypothetical protein